MLLLSCSELAQTEGKPVSPVFPIMNSKCTLLRKMKGKYVFSHIKSQPIWIWFSFVLFQDEEHGSQGEFISLTLMDLRLILWHAQCILGFLPPTTTHKWNSSTGVWCHSQIQIPSLEAEWNWPWVSACSWVWTAKSALVPLPSLKEKPKHLLVGTPVLWTPAPIIPGQWLTRWIIT